MYIDTRSTTSIKTHKERDYRPLYEEEECFSFFFLYYIYIHFPRLHLYRLSSCACRVLLFFMTARSFCIQSPSRGWWSIKRQWAHWATTSGNTNNSNNNNSNDRSTRERRKSRKRNKRTTGLAPPCHTSKGAWQRRGGKISAVCEKISSSPPPPLHMFYVSVWIPPTADRCPYESLGVLQVHPSLNSTMGEMSNKTKKRKAESRHLFFSHLIVGTRVELGK